MNWRDLKTELLKNPDFKKEYNALEPEYRLLKAIVEQRVKKADALDADLDVSIRPRS